jgi:predicted RNA-binding Zn-ribbon protein involved in translation (DUF1610 family)
MVKKVNICSSCGMPLKGEGYTYFICPICGKSEIGRCANCREKGVEYSCPTCNFKGP